MKVRTVLISAVLVLATACRGDSAAAPEPAPCTPSGSALIITAKADHSGFDKTCLAAPAGTKFTIVLANKEKGASHNIMLVDKTGLTMFSSDFVKGVGKATFKVKALPAGRYLFFCKPHRDYMKGDFVVA